ncbi:hypothetical protein B0H17DRAFT_1140466 [Mycena rosella]|uniref:Uncharacterized protein n=1 Tax=Mycena rosella TaxID=1033263 RepID=A0AAD7D1W7_MYCRO|nr:hypothetical protein B0H17DRAFT_1140466 [Mycena rosella]
MDHGLDTTDLKSNLPMASKRSSHRDNSAATKKDQASLYRVSKLFHALCLPILNRTVRLAHYASASAFCSGIIANPSRGQAVCFFAVSYMHSWSNIVDRPAPLRQLLIQPMKLMSRLEYQSVNAYVLKRSDRFTLLQLTFPRLLACDETIRPITECLPRFTGLVYLYLAMEWYLKPFRKSVATMEMDRSAVEAWGAACPTLETCCLNHHAWRQMDGKWKDYPMLDFRAQAG